MRELYDALLGAAAFNLLQFDTAFERGDRQPDSPTMSAGSTSHMR